MKPVILHDQALTPDGRPMTLSEHDGAFTIRVAGVELMTTRQHHSEEQLARVACEPLRDTRAARVLIGGLGFGYTLRAALGILRRDAVVTVVEIMPAVVAWNRERAYGLAGDALEDPRVEVVIGDACDVLGRHRSAFDAVILDVDNGAEALTTAFNGRLYSASGVARAHAALRPGGLLAVWSAAAEPAFVERMRRVGFTVTTERARLHAGGTKSRGRGQAHLIVGRR